MSSPSHPVVAFACLIVLLLLAGPAALTAQSPQPDPPASSDKQPPAATKPAPAPTERTPAVPPPGAAIDDVYRSFAAAYRDLDADAVTALYTTDAFYLPPAPQQPLLRGHEEIRPLFASLFDRARERGDRLTMEFRIVERRVEGSLATDVGYYRLTVTPPAEVIEAGEDGVRVDVGKFIIVSVRTGDAAKPAERLPGGRSADRPTDRPTWRFRVDSFSPALEEAFEEASGRILVAPARPPEQTQKPASKPATEQPRPPRRQVLEEHS